MQAPGPVSLLFCGLVRLCSYADEDTQIEPEQWQADGFDLEGERSVG